MRAAEQLAKAGTRLALILNDALGGTQPAKAQPGR